MTGHASYQVCPQTFTYADLDDGSHTGCVYVVDTKGAPDPVPASGTTGQWVRLHKIIAAVGQP